MATTSKTRTIDDLAEEMCAQAKTLRAEGRELKKTADAKLSAADRLDSAAKALSKG